MKAKEFNIRLINKWKEQSNKIKMQILSPFVYLYLKIIGVELGKRISFYGRPIFIRTYRSSVVIGDGCRFRSKLTSNLIGINHPCIIATHTQAAKIIIGESCGFSGTTIGAFKEIKLGNNVRCGANTLITDSDWHLSDPRVGEAKPVFLDDNVWLGYGVIVMKGVTIGKNSIIGAGSVVTKDLPANVIAVGNPCIIVKSIKL